MQQVQVWERTTNGGGARALRKPLLSPSLPASLIPWLPPYQIGSKAQVAHSQQSYKAKEGRVRETGQVADHKVEVDGADESHDAGGDDFAQPGVPKDPEGLLAGCRGPPGSSPQASQPPGASTSSELGTGTQDTVFSDLCGLEQTDPIGYLGTLQAPHW